MQEENDHTEIGNGTPASDTLKIRRHPGEWEVSGSVISVPGGIIQRVLEAQRLDDEPWDVQFETTLHVVGSQVRDARTEVSWHSSDAFGDTAERRARLGQPLLGLDPILGEVSRFRLGGAYIPLREDDQADVHAAILERCSAAYAVLGEDNGLVVLTPDEHSAAALNSYFHPDLVYAVDVAGMGQDEWIRQFQRMRGSKPRLVQLR